MWYTNIHVGQIPILINDKIKLLRNEFFTDGIMHTLLIPALKKQRQVDLCELEVEASLVWSTERIPG